MLGETRDFIFFVRKEDGTMKEKNMIIISIIIGLVTIALPILNALGLFGTKLPSYMFVSPAVLWCVIILPALARKKNNSDKK